MIHMISCRICTPYNIATKIIYIVIIIEDIMEKYSDRLILNIHVAKIVSDLVYPGFINLNKPTHSVKVIKPKTLDVGPFQLWYTLEDNKVCGFSPGDLDWYNSFEKNRRLLLSIRHQRRNRTTILLNHFRDRFLFKNNYNEIKYFTLLLRYRANYTSMNAYRSGNCGELIKYVVMFLLINRRLLSKDYNIDVVSIESKYSKKNKTIDHVIAVIDRRPDSNIHNPPEWGQDAIVLDPWNRGAYFTPDKFSVIPYYKYGEWEIRSHYSLKQPDRSKLDVNDKKYLDLLEEYICSEPLPNDVYVKYIDKAFEFVENRIGN